jgi:hypothetical protein
MEEAMKIKIWLVMMMMSAVAVCYGVDGYRVNFLEHGPSVKAFGRGEAGTASLKDATAAYYNPALLSNVEGTNVYLTHHMLFSGTNFDFLGVALPAQKLIPGLKEEFNVGFSVTSLISGPSEGYDNEDNQTGKLSGSQMAYMVSASKKISKLADTNVGVSVKYISQNLDGNSGGAPGADIGASKELVGPKIFGNDTSVISLGAMVRNIWQPVITLKSNSDTYQPQYRLGVGLGVPTLHRENSEFDVVNVMIDGVVQDEHGKAKIGAEYGFYNKYFVRAGAFDQHTTFGCGMKYDKFEFDYAMDLTATALGTFHRIGIGYSF